MMAGQVLAGRYELGERLGVGGMSTVVRAFDRRLERDVAVKLLAEHLADDDQFVARFRREALAAARLVHPNIVQVFDFGLDEPTPPPLHRHGATSAGSRAPRSCATRALLELRDALSIVAQACRGLEYAHRNGVVHRDVKPGNLLRGEDGVVKLADFGIAKAFSDESSITQVGSVLGTAAYLAPEQAAGEEAGPRRRPLRARRRHLPAAVRAPALRGAVADRAGAQAAARGAAAPGRAQPRGPAAARDGRRPRARARPAPAPGQRRRAAQPCWPTARAASGPPTTDPTTSRAAGPPTSATSVVGQQRTGATGVARAAGPAAPAARRRARRARRRRLRHPGAASARAAAPQRRARKRFLGVLLVLLLLAAGGAAAVVATSNSDQAVTLRRVVYDDVQQGVDAVKQLVNDNTK